MDTIDPRAIANEHGGNITGPYLHWSNLYNFRPDNLSGAEKFAATITERTGIPASVEVVVHLHREPSVQDIGMAEGILRAQRDILEHGLPPIPQG